jgi:uncharacterized cupin superfamily protein
MSLAKNDRIQHLKVFFQRKNMSQITIEHNPSQERLQELRVADWPIWEKEISSFPIDFDETETAYVLEGEIIVTPVGGEPVRILPGDLVIFHEGLDSHWEVVKPLRKHYHYD